MLSLLIGNFGKILKRNTKNFLFVPKFFTFVRNSREPLENIIERTIKKKTDEKQTLIELKEEFSQIEKFDKFNRSISLSNHLSNLLSFFSLKLNEIKKIEGIEEAETQKNYSELFKILNVFQNHEDRLALNEQNKKVLKELFKNIIETYSKINEKDEKKKGILIEALYFFLQRLYSSLETDNYIKFFKSALNETDFKTKTFFHQICEISTHEIFKKHDYLPEDFLNFIKVLKKEKNWLVSKNLYPVHRNAIIKMISLFDKYSFEKIRVKQIIEKENFDFENISIEKLEGFENLSEINYVLHKIFRKKKNEISNHLKSEGILNQISILLSVKLESYLLNSNLQNIVYFGILMVQNNFLFPSKVLSVYNDFMNKKIVDIFTLIYFLVPFEEGKTNVFINDKSLRLLIDYSPSIFEKKVDSFDVVMHLKLYNLHYKSLIGDHSGLYKLLTTVNKVLVKNYHIITSNHKFYLADILQNLDISGKHELLLPYIVQNINLCPPNLLPTIIKILCDSCYFLKDISEYEKLIFINLANFNCRQIMEILRGYIYHLKGSKPFLTALLEKFFELAKTDNVDFMITYNMYQVIWTLLNFYPFEISLKESNLKSYLLKYEVQFFKYDPTKNKAIKQSKEFYELEKIFKNLNLAFEKNVLIGINNVDYVIENKFVLEFFGKNDYCDSGNKLRGFLLWKERNIGKKNKYEYVKINTWKWRSIDTFTEKQAKIKTILNSEKLNSTF